MAATLPASAVMAIDKPEIDLTTVLRHSENALS